MLRKTIVVLGARSGTSALAGTLSLLGCATPKHLMPANAANPKGYFEPQHIANMHDELLQSVNMHWSDWKKFPCSWFHSQEAEYFRRRLAARFEEDFGDAPLSVFKEPRLCRLIPLWEPIFVGLSVEPLFCFVERHPLEVAASLQARDGCSIDQALLYYLRNHLDAERSTRHRMRAFVQYDDLLRDWQKVINSIEERLCIRLRGTGDPFSTLSSFLEPNLRHYQRDDDPNPGDIPKLAYDVNNAFCGLSADSSDPALTEKLDRLYDDFDDLIKTQTLPDIHIAP